MNLKTCWFNTISQRIAKNHTEQSRMKLLSLLPICNIALGTHLSLHARHVTDGREYNVGQFDCDLNKQEIGSITEITDGHLIENERYCIGVKAEDKSINIPCFSLIELIKPLHYNLILDIVKGENGNDINKFSLVYNETANGIVPVFREAVDSEKAPAIKLKKVTKTYADKKKESESTAVEEDSELDERSWMEKNWRMLVIGVLVYTFVANGLNPKNEKKEQ